jgi:hypothetical protein
MSREENNPCPESGELNLLAPPTLFKEGSLKIEYKFLPKLIDIFTCIPMERKCFSILPVDRCIRMKTRMILNRIKDPIAEANRTVQRLLFLPYTTFGFRQNSENDRFLVGVTDSIHFASTVYEQVGDSFMRKVAKFGSLGAYAVCVSVKDIIHESMDKFHFVPLDNIRTCNRHFHHKAEERCRNPLDCKTTTCRASIGPLMRNALHIADIVAIFETAYLFLEKVDLNSVLAWPECETRLSDQEYARIKNISVAQAIADAYGEHFPF